MEMTQGPGEAQPEPTAPAIPTAVTLALLLLIIHHFIHLLFLHCSHRFCRVPLTLGEASAGSAGPAHTSAASSASACGTSSSAAASSVISSSRCRIEWMATRVLRKSSADATSGPAPALPIFHGDADDGPQPSEAECLQTAAFLKAFEERHGQVGPDADRAAKADRAAAALLRIQEPAAVPLAVPLTLGEAAGPGHASDSGAAAGPASSSGETAGIGLVPAPPRAPDTKPAKCSAAGLVSSSEGHSGQGRAPASATADATAPRTLDFLVYFTYSNWQRGAGKYHKVATCTWLHKHRQSAVGNNTEGNSLRNGLSRCSVCWP